MQQHFSSLEYIFYHNSRRSIAMIIDLTMMMIRLEKWSRRRLIVIKISLNANNGNPSRVKKAIVRGKRLPLQLKFLMMRQSIQVLVSMIGICTEVSIGLKRLGMIQSLDGYLVLPILWQILLRFAQNIKSEKKGLGYRW